MRTEGQIEGFDTDTLSAATGMRVDKALIFLHIPKAGGTTLHSVIARQFPHEAVFSIGGARVQESIHEFKSLPRDERQRIRCLKGHMAFGLHKYLPRPATYITLVRHPVDRMISHYYYVLRKPVHYLHHEVTSRNMSLSDYVSSDLSPELTNGQTRLISGLGSVDSRRGGEAVSADVLGIAERNLQDCFTAAGLTERFDESLVLFKRLLGWGNIFYTKRNVARGRPTKYQISRETIGVIEERNQFDLQLYEFAKQRFEDMICDQGSSFKSELRSFRIFNRVYCIAWTVNSLRRRGMDRAKLAMRHLLAM